MTDKTDVKQYVLVVDEMSMSLWSALVPSLRFLAIEGLPIKDSESHLFLVTPVSTPAKMVPEGTS